MEVSKGVHAVFFCFNPSQQRMEVITFHLQVQSQWRYKISKYRLNIDPVNAAFVRAYSNRLLRSYGGFTSSSTMPDILMQPLLRLVRWMASLH